MATSILVFFFLKPRETVSRHHVVVMTVDPHASRWIAPAVVDACRRDQDAAGGCCHILGYFKRETAVKIIRAQLVPTCRHPGIQVG